MSPMEILEMARTTRKLTEMSHAQLDEIRLGTQISKRLVADARKQIETLGRSSPPPPRTFSG